MTIGDLLRSGGGLVPIIGIAYLAFATWTLERFTFSLGHGVTSEKLTAIAVVVGIIWAARRQDPHPRFPAFPTTATLAGIVTVLLGAYAVASAVVYGRGVASYLASNAALLILVILAIQRRRDVDVLMLAAAVGALAVAIATFAQTVVHAGIPSDGATAFYGNNIRPALYTWLGALLLWPFLRRPDGELRRGVAIALGFLGVAVVLNLARGPIIVASITGGYLYLRSYGAAASLAKRIAAYVLILVPALAATAIAVWRYSTEGTQGLNAFLRGRLYLADAGWNMFMDSPLMGHGVGSFRANWAQYVTHFEVSREAAAEDIPTHSAYLSTAAELGMAGLLLYVILLALLLVAVRQQQRFLAASGMFHEWRLSLALEVAILAYMIHGLLDNSGWQERAFVLLVGFVIGLDEIRRADTERSGVERRHPSLAMPVTRRILTR